jgi:hypothetical protein
LAQSSFHSTGGSNWPLGRLSPSGLVEHQRRPATTAPGQDRMSDTGDVLAWQRTPAASY